MSPALPCRLRGAAVTTLVVAAGLTVPVLLAAPAQAVPVATAYGAATVAVGERPLALAVDPASHTAYVGNAASHTLSVVQGNPPAVTDDVEIGNYSRAVVLDAADHTVYVLTQYGPGLQLIDTDSLEVTATVGVEADPVALGVDPRTNTAYVANYSSNSVSVSTDGQPAASVSVGYQPNTVVLDPATHYAYVANSGGSTVSVVSGTAFVADIGVGPNPNSMDVDPATHTAYVANSGGSTVSVITGLDVTATVEVGGTPNGVVVDPTTHTAYVTSRDAGTLSVIRDGAVTATVPVGANPQQIGIDPSTHTVYVGHEDGALTVVDGTTATVVATVPVARSATAIAVDPTTHKAYVTHYGGTLSVVAKSPVVTAVTPASGSPAGGRTVTITGSGFTDATGVRFGSTAATAFTVDSPTQITATAPAGRNGQVVDVTVVSPFGASATSAADRYKYVKATPVLTTTPSDGVEAGGTISDVATLTRGATPTGTVTFSLYGPDDDSCQGTPVVTRTVPVDGGEASSGDVTVTDDGTYQWTATYSGDANNVGLSVACGDATDVTAGPLDHLVLAPSTATIAAAGSQAYTAEAFDAYNNDLGDATADTTFTIAGGGSCTDATCTSKVAGDHTVTGTDGAATGTATLTVTAGAADHLELTPESASITAGTSQTYTAESQDRYGNPLGDVTADVTFTIDGGGSCDGATCTSTVAGDHTVTAVDATDETYGAATLTVTPAAADNLTISAPVVRILAGQTTTYTVGAFDRFGNSLGDVTADTTITIDGGTCDGAVCGSTVAGSHTVTATFAGRTVTTVLRVTPAGLNRLALTPSATTIAAGATATFVVTGYDRYGNVRGDLTATSTLTVRGGSCIDATCTATTAGRYPVTAQFGAKTATAQLTVVAGAASAVRISPTTSTVGVGGSQTYAVTAYDRYGNTVGDVTADTSFGIKGGSCDGSTCTSTKVARHVVTATYRDLPAVTATLRVIGVNR